MRVVSRNESPVASATSPRPARRSQACNLCHRHFAAQTVFDRFCHRCKTDSELLHFYEWLPAGVSSDEEEYEESESAA